MHCIHCFFILKHSTAIQPCVSWRSIHTRARERAHLFCDCISVILCTPARQSRPIPYVIYFGTQLQIPSAFTASANFSLKSFSASTQTRACCLLGNSNSEGRRSELNCSDASRGSSVGKWSIETTERGGRPGLSDRVSMYVIIDPTR